MKRALEKENPAADLKVSPAVAERELCTWYLSFTSVYGASRILQSVIWQYAEVKMLTEK